MESDKVKLSISTAHLPVGMMLNRKSVVVDGVREVSIYMTPEQIVKVLEHNNVLIAELRHDLENARDEIRLLKVKLNPPKFTADVETGNRYGGGYGD